jgi:NodT family efflux transporter outer membrane factor (OMF) lipoprotein
VKYTSGFKPDQNEKSAMKSVVPVIIALFVGLTAVRCTPFLPPERPSFESELPQTYSSQITQPTSRQRWWEEFDDSELNGLIEKAFGGNLTLKESWARLKQARALAVIAGAASYPDLSVDGGTFAGRRRTATNGQRKTESVEEYSLGLISNYELDLWGRVRSEHEAALLSASASQEDLNTAAVTLAAAVTERWVGIVSQRMQRRLLEQQLESNLTVLELLELRFRNSLASALDVFQQSQIVERSRAQIPLVEQAEGVLQNELALLLGKHYLTAPTVRREIFSIPADVPETGLPVQLLTDRPDVRAAALRLQSADWDVAAARADRLPSIRLTGRAGYQADKIDLLFDNWLLNLAADLTAPLFDGQRRAAEVERTQAVVAEKLAAYRQTILTAVKEVEDALINERKLREHIKGLEAQLMAAQNALDQAGLRYRKGLNDYLPVLTQLLAVQNLERDLIQRKADLLIARVSLYRALGGTWTDSLVPLAME